MRWPKDYTYVDITKLPRKDSRGHSDEGVSAVTATGADPVDAQSRIYETIVGPAGCRERLRPTAIVPRMN